MNVRILDHELNWVVMTAVYVTDDSRIFAQLYETHLAISKIRFGRKRLYVYYANSMFFSHSKDISLIVRVH
jgi:hypothetical protein